MKNGTPAATVIAAALANGSRSLRSTSRAQRNPMLLFLLAGSFLLRFDTRRFVGLLFHELLSKVAGCWQSVAFTRLEVD